MRPGETDPEITKQRAPEPLAWHTYVGTLITVSALIASVALQWGVFNTTLTSQQKEMAAIEAAQSTQQARISNLEGQASSMVARMGQFENQGIPEHLSKLDTLVAAITQQQVDQKAQSDRAHDERIRWQDAMSEKMDKLISAVAHLEGQKDRPAR